MNRYYLLVLVLLTLAVPFVLRALASHSMPSPASSHELTLVIISPNAEAVRTEFAEAFSDWLVNAQRDGAQSENDEVRRGVGRSQ